MEEQNTHAEADFNLETPAAPTLVFGAEPEEKAPAAGVLQKPAEIPGGITEKEASLTPAKQKQVNDFAKQIDLENSQAILSYGAGTQKKMADFSDKTLAGVRTKDMGEVGSMITSLVTELKNFDADEDEKKSFSFFRKTSAKIDGLKAKYAKVETNVDTISGELQKHQVTLMKDIAMLDQMYDLNLSYFKELTMYILAGQKKLEEVRNTTLPALQQKAAETGKMEDAQKAKDTAALCERFEKKLYDLELTRTIAMQTAPQIRMVQSSDTMMAEKIQTTIVNTIPLWKNQMVIAIGVEHAQQAARAEREVNDMTNALLRKNADKLKTAATGAARESERGIVDIETLKHTNEQLISTLDEVMQIQKDGAAKREEARKELSGIEAELKQKMLEVSRA